MGASASVDGTVTFSDEDKQSLIDISSLLKAYHIKTSEDLIELNTKYEAMKAEGTHGLPLLKSLHNTMHDIGEKNETKDEKTTDSAAAAEAAVEVKDKATVGEEETSTKEGETSTKEEEKSFGEQAKAEGNVGAVQVARRGSLMNMTNELDAFRERVKILMKQVAKENFLNFMVGIDGSEASNNAYEVVMEELCKSKDGEKERIKHYFIYYTLSHLIYLS